MLFKSSKFYSCITDIPESIFRTPTFKIYYNIPILAFCLINFTFPGSKCIHYVIDNKILHIKGSVFVSETLELRAGIAGIRAFSFVGHNHKVELMKHKKNLRELGPKDADGKPINPTYINEDLT